WSGVRGMMVVRPYGWAMWESIMRAFDDMIKESGHENWAFPLLIPREFLLKEAEHVEGFAPEVAWVTRAGGDMQELEEPLAVRPTSETIIARAYDISFSSKENERELCYSTSWGISTRLVGALVMAHGDDSGLIVPPTVAPIQVVVVPIFRDADGRAKVEKFINSWTPDLKVAGIRHRVDWRDERPG